MVFKQKGFSIIEILVTVSILSMLVGLVGYFMREIIVWNSTISGDITAVYETRAILKDFAVELRSTSPSSLGAYPIESAATSSLVFFADTNADGLKERIRYFLDGDLLRRGSIVPSGSPLTYNPANEKIKIMVRGIRPDSTPVFEYYDEFYGGTEAPLSPISVADIRLVKIYLRIHADQRASLPVIGTTQVTLRNLKDNL